MLRKISFLFLAIIIGFSGEYGSWAENHSERVSVIRPLLIIDCQKPGAIVKGQCLEFANYAVFRLNFLENSESVLSFYSSYVGQKHEGKIRFLNFWQVPPSSRNQYHQPLLKNYSRLFSHYTNKEKSMILVEIVAQNYPASTSNIISDVTTFLQRKKIKHYFYSHPSFQTTLKKNFYAKTMDVKFTFTDFDNSDNFHFLADLKNILVKSSQNWQIVSPLDAYPVLEQLTTGHENISSFSRLLIFHELLPWEYSSLVHQVKKSIRFRIKFLSDSGTDRDFLMRQIKNYLVGQKKDKKIEVYFTEIQ